MLVDTGRNVSVLQLHTHVMLLRYVVMKTYCLHTFFSIMTSDFKSLKRSQKQKKN